MTSIDEQKVVVTAEKEQVPPPEPIPVASLPTEELRGRFRSLFNEAYHLISSNNHDDEERIENAGRALCDRIRVEVSVYPTLAKTVAAGMSQRSLLKTMCERTCNRDICHDGIRFLITMNPHALLWRCDNEPHPPPSPLYTIATDTCHCTLLPWIAGNYPWVFDDHEVRRIPPHHELVCKHSNGELDASIVRQFYEAYPQGLQQKDKYIYSDVFPLHRCLVGWENCDPDLFEWMAKSYPEAMPYRWGGWGFTALHQACMALSSTVEEGVMAPNKCTEGNARICCFLITECPQTVRCKGNYGRGLPIHYLARRCNRNLVQDIMILLLKEFPECIQYKAGFFLPKLPGVPFIQQIGPLLQQETAIEEECAWLALASASFSTFASSNHHGADHRNVVKAAAGVFGHWVIQRTQVEFPVLQQQIQRQISEVRAQFEGDDPEEEPVWDSESDYSDSDDWDSDEEFDSDESDS